MRYIYILRERLQDPGGGGMDLAPVKVFLLSKLTVTNHRSAELFPPVSNL